jgi:23S rRNA pseudouridine2605 synthase
VSEERLQKLLARAGVASRRKAEELIREGRVTINGQVASIGDKADLEHDSVKLDERRIQAPAEHRYLLLNKPRGVMSTVSDPVGRTTVIDLVPPAMRRALAPVGRLDYQTEGLLLLTDDGDLAQRVAHPSSGCWKTYEVKVRGRPVEEQLERLRTGIVLEGRRTAPCRIYPLQRRLSAGPRRRRAPLGDSSWWSVELGEGRTRQIRTMFQRIGHPVQKLRRVAIGPVSDPNLPVGSLRELTGREVAALRKAGPPPPRKPPAVPRAAPAGAASAASPARSAPAKASPHPQGVAAGPVRAPGRAGAPGAGRASGLPRPPGPAVPAAQARQPGGAGAAARRAAKPGEPAATRGRRSKPAAGRAAGNRRSPSGPRRSSPGRGSPAGSPKTAGGRGAKRPGGAGGAARRTAKPGGPARSAGKRPAARATGRPARGAPVRGGRRASPGSAAGGRPAGKPKRTSGPRGAAKPRRGGGPARPPGGRTPRRGRG